jgi:hypothetical protein
MSDRHTRRIARARELDRQRDKMIAATKADLVWELAKVARAAKHEPAPKARKPRVPTRRERSIEAACCAYARERGCLVFKLRPPPAGIPDRLIVLPGREVWFCEFKKLGLRPSPKQAGMAIALSRCGYFVRAEDSVERFKAALDDYITRK